MKRTDPLTVKEIIDRVLDDESIRDTARAQRLCYMWPEVVGPGINRHTVRRYVADRILHVYINSASLKQELLFHRDRLVQLLNEAAGADVITDITFH